ncbi:Response regulator receiver [Rhodovulum sp. PH10]|uniref:response regulator n=1 Tax=Rhodovulum sp. PH10 TaxID=1187851 RepID=UPI00027C2ACD|nr:response regulator [Rhodovulum sp. PH10]EJW10076.1 Response regulator receiver [Rhodovulum sp. PH10]
MTRDDHNEALLPTVVVVNNDSGLRNALGFALAVEGFSVRTFARGRDLLAAADLPDGACVVTDAWLPDMSGLELVERLRDRRRGLPAIMITADASPRLRRRAKEAGVAVIEQPLSGDSVVNGVVALLTTLSDRAAC